MNNTILYIAVIILAIFEIVQLIRHAELKNRFEHLQKESRKYLEIFEHVTRVVEATESMSDTYTEQSEWMMNHTSNALEKMNSAIQAHSRELDELGKTYESLSKRNQLLDEELKKSCECCKKTKERLDTILTLPQIKPMPIPEGWLNNDPNQFRNPNEWDKKWYEFFHRDDSISESIVPDCQTDPVGFLGKAIHVAQSTAAAVSGLKDLAETAVDAVKDSIDSVPDPDEFEPEEWREESLQKDCEELRNGPGEELGEGTDDENL